MSRNENSSNRFFLARTEEQEKFKQVLRSRKTDLIGKFFPTFSSPFRKPRVFDQPHILLFYGESGMGKSTLLRRFNSIIESEREFKNAFKVINLDWEEKTRKYTEIQVAHDKIHPESVLRVFYNEFCKSDPRSRNHFSEYRKIDVQIKETERIVDQEINSKPDVDINRKLSSLGSKTVSWIIRKYSGVEIVSQEFIENTLEDTIQVSAELLSQARNLIAKTLNPDQLELYIKPHEHLAEALGRGLANLAEKTPIIIIMDTYEIVDRPECDYTLRNAIEAAGSNVIWVIAGRSNLAKSKRLQNIEFRGYRQDFPEEKVYAKRLGEFGRAEIKKFFERAVPDKEPTKEDLIEFAKFSLGIPFVIAQSAELFKKGSPLSEISKPVQSSLDGSTPHKDIIKKTTERFLNNCFDEDLQFVYALALMRRTDVNLLRVMLGIDNVETKLKALWEKFSFVDADKISLDSNLAGYLQEYMLNPIPRFDTYIQELNQKAIDYLSEKLEHRKTHVKDISELIKDEVYTELVLDLSHYHFWKSEENGWNFLLPRFIESWAYNSTLVNGLLKVVDTFRFTFEPTGQRRASLLRRVLETFSSPKATETLVREFEDLLGSVRLGDPSFSEHRAILLVRKGKAQRLQGFFRQAFENLIEAEQNLPENAYRLKIELAEEFYLVGIAFIWEQGNSKKVIYSQEGEEAIEKAIYLDSNKASFYYCKAVLMTRKEDLDEAVKCCQKAISIDKNYAKAYNCLGIIYQSKGNYDKAIDAYCNAVYLDRHFCSPYINLATIYRAQGRYNEATDAFNKILEIDHDNVKAFISLGNLYRDQNSLNEAIKSYRNAISLDPNFPISYNGLGWTFLLQEKPLYAIQEFEKAIELDPEECSYYFNLGTAYAKLNDAQRARDLWQKGLDLCRGNSGLRASTRAFYKAIIDFRDFDQGYAELREMTEEGLVELRGLRNILSDAEVISKCPVKVRGLNKILNFLKSKVH